MFLSKVISLYGLLRATFQKARVFSSGEPRGIGCKSGRLQQVQYQIGIRTLNARRMFRKLVGAGLLTGLLPKRWFKTPEPGKGRA